MERLVESLADLPPALMYVAVALSTLIENVFPPTPSDLAVALGGFLSQRGLLSPTGLWWAAWLPNMAGATLVYLLARRYGREFLASRLGRRVLPADALVAVEREYLRFGLAGIFISRLLPGFRAIVAGFVGLLSLSPWAVLTPMALASGLWYGALIWAGARVGAGWNEISAFVGHLNLALALVAAAAVALVVLWIWKRAVSGVPERRRLLQALRRAMVPGSGGSPSAADADLAGPRAAALLQELAQAEPAISPAERRSIAAHLRDRWRVGEAAGATAEEATTGETPVPAEYAREDRVALAERLYRVALDDGVLTSHEERIMRRAGDLLGLTGEDLAEARKRAKLE